MTRLLFVDQHGEMGGGQRVLMSLLRIAVAAGYQTSVLAPGGGALEAAIADAFGQSVTFVSCETPRLAHGRKGLGDVLKMLAYGWRFRRHLPLLAAQDVIYVNGLRHLPHLLLLTRGLKARMIHHVHLRHSAIERKLLQLAARARNTFALVANSRFIRDTLGFTSDRIVLVENALDGAFAGLPFTDRFAAGTPWKAAVVGTLRPEKGQDIAIAAVADQPGMTLAIIGSEGPGAADWAQALRQQAGPNVEFAGATTDVIRELQSRAIQFSLVPSRAPESFGLSAVESMACSCLTIVSGQGGLAEIAERTGALVAPDAQSLRRTLAGLCARPAAELAALARSQHDRTLAHYGPARFESEIAALLNGAARAGGHIAGARQ